nr:BEL1-like homeodomain protein 11 isoform X1 [Coffea arabica]
MVSQDSPSNPNTSILHQFIISNSIASQNQFGGEHFDAYANGLSGGSTYDSLGSTPSLQCFGERIPRSIDIVNAPQLTDESDVNHPRHLMDLLGASNEANYHAQRLSLSLGTRTLVSPVAGRQRTLTSTLVDPGYIISGDNAREACNPRGDSINSSYSFGGSVFAASSTSPNHQSSCISYGTEALAVAISNSKYLRPAQWLLDEVVKVGSKAIDLSNEKYARRLSSSSKRGSLKLRSEINLEFTNNEVFTEKHELQAKLLKLIALLEEVERRYEQYYHHMDELVSSFEMIAGLGAGKSYTALALQAMSRHFCCLREAILSQIYVTKRKISEDMPKISSDMSQLSLFDQENRHSRLSLQQLSMIQSSRQAWRPIRGLPETSVAILRSWLFEHFLHPSYPNDSEKLTLASQTGLSKNQVSNWFINARVRLWKPMIEEMYKEEFAESYVESNPSISREGFADSAED